ncbi:NADH-ubiquinone oxidoreductase B18 subunit-domain-containing protein [Xylariaceae sp. FL0016]|nr:NADH-ubiquinone oxidoreductase B18 subunit-domain-containing protein [Xylariaceae sp. FL0016]
MGLFSSSSDAPASKHPLPQLSMAFHSLANATTSVGAQHLKVPKLTLVRNTIEATREEMREAKLPLAYRDSCANLLIPLNRCRVDTYYLPWKCENERHTYEKCQYEEFKKRVAKMDELREAKDGARSN